MIFVKRAHAEEKKPCYNNFAATCRQAYEETRHLYYRNAAFKADYLYWLDEFIQDTRSSNLALIQDLTVDKLKRPSAFHVHTPKLSTPEPRYMRDLQMFRGLKVLRMRAERPLNLIWRDRTQHPYIHLLRGLVKNSRYLESLQTIELQAWEHVSRYKFYSRFQLNYDQLPGWVYSVETKDDRYLRYGMNWMYEVLQKVHGPHPVKKLKPARKYSIDDDIFGECMQLFSSESWVEEE